VPEQKTLQNIISENWTDIAKVLKPNLKKKPENALALSSYFRPVLESAAKVFNLPLYGVFVSANLEYKEDMNKMIKMGFAEKDYGNQYGLTIKGVELMEVYLKATKPGFHTSAEIMTMVAENTKSF
jgi:hypothetical protein